MPRNIIDLTSLQESRAGNIELRLAVVRTTDRSNLHVPFEVSFNSREGAEPFLIVNPTLELKVYRRTGPGGRIGDALRLPICTGSLQGTGGLSGHRALIWRPYANLSTELILKLDTMRSLEHGLHVDFELDAAVLRFVKLNSEAEWSVAAKPDSLRWLGGFDITLDTWRELLDLWGWPRPRVFELNPGSFADLAEFEHAASALRTAERQIVLGQWPQAIAHARIVVEAVLRHLGYRDKYAAHWNAMQEAGLPSEMSQLIKAFNAVTSLAHHPTGNSDAWKRAEARFLVQLAASLAEYVATLPAPNERELDRSRADG